MLDARAMTLGLDEAALRAPVGPPRTPATDGERRAGRFTTAMRAIRNEMAVAASEHAHDWPPRLVRYPY